MIIPLLQKERSTDDFVDREEGRRQRMRKQR